MWRQLIANTELMASTVPFGAFVFALALKPLVPKVHDTTAAATSPVRRNGDTNSKPRKAIIRDYDEADVDTCIAAGGGGSSATGVHNSIVSHTVASISLRQTEHARTNAKGGAMYKLLPFDAGCDPHDWP